MSEELKNTPEAAQDELVIIPDYEEEERTEEEYRQRAINSRIHLTEEEMAPREPVKMNLWQRIENFFFHYKKIVYVVVGVILGLVLCIVFSRQAPRDYDIHIFTGEQQLELHSLTPVIDSYFSQYASDLDGDGEGIVLSEYYDLTANQFYAVYDENGEMVLREDGDPLTEPISQANPENYVEYIAATATIGKDMKEGEICLYLFDELNYQAVVEQYGEEVFAKFGDEHRIALYKDEKFASYCDENGITTKLSLCLIAKNERIEGDEKLLENWQNAYDFVMAIVDDCPGLI